MISTKCQILHCLWKYTVISRFQHKPSSAACYSFSIKKWCRLSFTCQNSVVLSNTEKRIEYIIVLEIHFTHDVISSNLVLLVLTSCKFSAQTLLNAQKSLCGHTKTSVTSQLFKSIKFCLIETLNNVWKFILKF